VSVTDNPLATTAPTPEPAQPPGPQAISATAALTPTPTGWRATSDAEHPAATAPAATGPGVR
jgi:hypothetical protein